MTCIMAIKCFFKWQNEWLQKQLTKSGTMRSMSSRAASAFCSKPVITTMSGRSESLSGIVTCTSCSWRIFDTTVPRWPMIFGWNLGSTETSSLKLRNACSDHTVHSLQAHTKILCLTRKFFTQTVKLLISTMVSYKRYVSLKQNSIFHSQPTKTLVKFKHQHLL